MIESMARFSVKSAVISFMLGSVVGPAVFPIVKPFVRDAAKATIRMGLQLKRFAAEAAEDLEDLAAEAGAEVAAAKTDGALRPTARQA